MNYCPKCEIVIRGVKDCCPLCQGKVSEVPEDRQVSETSACMPFPVIERKVSSVTFIKIVTFLFLALEITFGMLNILFRKNVPWVSLVMLGIFVGWIDVLVAMYVRSNIIKLLTIEAYVACAVNCYVDYMTNMHGWSLAWVIPFILIGLGVITMTMAWIMRLRIGEFVAYIALDAAVSLLQLLPIYYDMNPVELPALICCACYMIFMAGIVVFRLRDLKSALGRRFNF